MCWGRGLRWRAAAVGGDGAAAGAGQCRGTTPSCVVVGVVRCVVRCGRLKGRVALDDDGGRCGAEIEKEALKTNCAKTKYAKTPIGNKGGRGQLAARNLGAERWTRRHAVSGIFGCVSGGSGMVFTSLESLFLFYFFLAQSCKPCLGSMAAAAEAD